MSIYVIARRARPTNGNADYMDEDDAGSARSGNATRGYRGDIWRRRIWLMQATRQDGWSRIHDGRQDLHETKVMMIGSPQDPGRKSRIQEICTYYTEENRRA